MKQEQEERDRRQEKLQAEKEKSSIEYQVQVEREKKGVSQLPFGQGVVPVFNSLPLKLRASRGISRKPTGRGASLARKEGLYR
jgi:hypothetical protein